MSEKRFVKANCREIEGQYWSFFNIDINKEDFNRLPVNDYGMVRLTMSARREPGKYWDTHYLTLNTYEGKKKEEEWEEIADTTEDDLPF